MPEEESYVTLPLHAIAHGRAGDKGDRVNISVIAYRPEFYDILTEQVTVRRVSKLFEHRAPVRVTRYELPNLRALNFVVDDVLEGGVNRSLNLDGHGKGPCIHDRHLIPLVTHVEFSPIAGNGHFSDVSYTPNRGGATKGFPVNDVDTIP